MSLDACAEIVAKGDPDRWLSLMSVPVATRARLLPIYAFNLEVARAPWISTEPMIGQMRLQWWRDALLDIANGTAPRRHEVVTPLAEVLTPEAAADLDALVLMRHRDLDMAPFGNRAALDHYLEETGGGLLRGAAQSLGGGGKGLVDAGYAGALAGYLRAVAELRARGCRPLPQDDPAWIRDLARDGLARWQAARQAGIDRCARPAVLALWRTPALLGMAARDPERVLNGSLDTSPARRHLSLALRTALGHW